MFTVPVTFAVVVPTTASSELRRAVFASPDAEKVSRRIGRARPGIVPLMPVPVTV